MHITLITCWLLAAAARAGQSQHSFISCAELCSSLTDHRHSSRSLRASCICPSEEASASASQSTALDDYGVYFEPADVYTLHEISFMPFFILNPILKLKLDPKNSKVVRKRKLFRTEPNQEVTHVKYEKKYNNDKGKKEFEKNYRPVYLDVDVQESEETKKPTLKKIYYLDQFHEIEESFSECVNLHLIKYFKANNISKTYYHQLKINNLTESHLISEIKNKCNLPANVVRQSLQEIKNTFPQLNELFHDSSKITKVEALEIPTQHKTFLSDNIISPTNENNKFRANYSIVEDIVIARISEEKPINRINNSQDVKVAYNSKNNNSDESHHTLKQDHTFKLVFDHNKNNDLSNLTIELPSSMTSQEKNNETTTHTSILLQDQDNNIKSILYENYFTTILPLPNNQDNITSKYLSTSNSPDVTLAYVYLGSENRTPYYPTKVNWKNTDKTTTDTAIQSNSNSNTTKNYNNITSKNILTHLYEIQKDKDSSSNASVKNSSILPLTSTSEHHKLRNANTIKPTFVTTVQSGEEFSNKLINTTELVQNNNEHNLIEQPQYDEDVTNDPFLFTHSESWDSNEESELDNVTDNTNYQKVKNVDENISDTISTEKNKTLHDNNASLIYSLYADNLNINMNEENTNRTVSTRSTTSSNLKLSHSVVLNDTKHYTLGQASPTDFRLDSTVTDIFIKDNNFDTKVQNIPSSSPVLEAFMNKNMENLITATVMELNTDNFSTEQYPNKITNSVIVPLIDNNSSVDINVEQDKDSDDGTFSQEQVGIKIVRSKGKKHILHVVPKQTKLGIIVPTIDDINSNKSNVRRLNLYSEKDIKIPKVITKEFYNETVISELDGTEMLPNNDFKNSTLQSTLMNQSTPKNKSSENESLLKGRLYFLFNKTRLPARFVQEDDGELIIGIDGITLCSRIMDGQNNYSLIINLICKCVQHGYCTSTYEESSTL